jgi:hypothetical protein
MRGMIDIARRHPRTAAFSAYVVLAAAVTWPLLPRFGSEIAGDHDGAWRTLWGFWWWSESFARGASPFFCDLLRWPEGAPMWLHTWNVPAALAVLPLWHATPGLPEVALYNAVVFASYPLAGYTTYLLCKELWGGQLAPFLAGTLYAVSAYHFGHAPGRLDAVCMEWSPLYFLGLVRTIRRHGVGGPMLAGVALALAATTSAYHLLFCALGTVVLIAAWFPTDRATLVSAAFGRRVVLLVVVFLALAGWLYVAVLRGFLAEPRAATGAGERASADLLSFFVPRTGSAAYIGYVALGLAAMAASRAKASRPWLLVALIGFVLALGPRLQLGGFVLPRVLLPFGWLAHAIPALGTGVEPARFTWLVTIGVTVAAGAALSHLVRGGRRGAAVAVAITALALVETWPRAMPTSSWPAPRFLRDLAKDGERWAVLDATSPPRQLWNQVLHRHPQVGGLAHGATLAAFLARDGAPRARQDAIRELQQLNVRFVIVDGPAVAVARALHLDRAYDGEGLVVFEVPPRAG